MHVFQAWSSRAMFLLTFGNWLLRMCWAHRVEPEEWLNVRYHIAIDGNTLAWSSTFTRLLMGCCLLKPESPTGHRLWYSDRFKPWLHYVPVEGRFARSRQQNKMVPGKRTRCVPDCYGRSGTRGRATFRRRDSASCCEHQPGLARRQDGRRSDPCGNGSDGPALRAT